MKDFCPPLRSTGFVKRSHPWMKRARQPLVEASLSGIPCPGFGLMNRLSPDSALVDFMISASQPPRDSAEEVWHGLTGLVAAFCRSSWPMWCALTW